MTSPALGPPLSVVDARIRVHHPCPYCDRSSESPGALSLLWCVNRRDTFLVTTPDLPELRRLTARLRSAHRARVPVAEGSSVLLELPDFEWAGPSSVTLGGHAEVREESRTISVSPAITTRKPATSHGVTGSPKSPEPVATPTSGTR
jgi:hypothetical protein